MKKLIIAALSTTILLSSGGLKIAEASNEENEVKAQVEIKVDENKDKNDENLDEYAEIYEVTEISGETVTVKYYSDELGSSKLPMNDSTFNVDIKEFPTKDVKVGEKYRIIHDNIMLPSNPAQFGKIFKIEDVNDYYDKDGDKSEETFVAIYKVKEVNEGAVLVTLESTKEDPDKDMTGSLFSIPRGDFKEADVKVGDYYKITTNRVFLKTYPGQFGKVFEVEKVNDSREKDLANAIYKNQIQMKAADILLKNSPKSVEDIKAELENVLKTSERNVEAGMKALSKLSNIDSSDEDLAIANIIRIMYTDKKDIKDINVKLAKSIYNSDIYVEAGKMLLKNSPKKTEGIKVELEKEIKKSEELVKKAKELLVIK